MYTTLYIINIKSGEQKQLTFPKKNELDDAPQVVGSTITWYRETVNEGQGDVWVKDGISEYRWLINVDSPPTFFNEK